MHSSNQPTQVTYHFCRKFCLLEGVSNSLVSFVRVSQIIEVVSLHEVVKHVCGNYGQPRYAYLDVLECPIGEVRSKFIFDNRQTGRLSSD